MTSQNTQEENVPNFTKSAIIHEFFGILEYTLILITILIYVKNIALSLTSIIIISGLFLILSYTILFKNPYYYISCLGLVFITIFPSAISMIFFIASTPWSYEPIRIFTIFGLVIEAFYIYLLIREVGYNKYTSYFHKRYGYPWSTVGHTLKGLFYSIKEFDKLDKGRQYWQDQNPEEIKKKKEELKRYEKRFKKKSLIWIQLVATITFIITFGVSLTL